MLDQELSRIPQTPQEARAIAWAIAQGWNLNVQLASKDDRDEDDGEPGTEECPFPVRTPTHSGVGQLSR